MAERFGGKWLSGRWTSGLQAGEMEDPRTGKVTMRNGLEGRGLSGRRTEGSESAATERFGAGKF